MTVTLLPDAPPGPTVTPTLTPTAILTGTTGAIAFYAESPYRSVQAEIAPARLGSFEWVRPLGVSDTPSPLPPVSPPEWMVVQETAQLAEVRDLYDALMNPPADRRFLENYDRYASDFTATATRYLNNDPTGDGAILVLLMTGYVSYLNEALGYPHLS